MLKTLHMPFSVGLRNCIGQNLAMFQLKLELVNILSRFKFTIDTTHVIEKVFFLTLRPKNAFIIPKSLSN